MSADADVVIYTDGGCDPNPGTGGWAAILTSGDNERELSGAAANTTNNRMELTAAVEALSALKRPCKVVVVTDSQYLQKGVTEWMAGWKRRGWRRAGGPVKNQDLWQQLDALSAEHDVHWTWVRGHAGHEYNERCDVLATEARRRFLAGGGA